MKLYYNRLLSVVLIALILSLIYFQKSPVVFETSKTEVVDSVFVEKIDTVFYPARNIYNEYLAKAVKNLHNDPLNWVIVQNVSDNSKQIDVYYHYLPDTSFYVCLDYQQLYSPWYADSAWFVNSYLIVLDKQSKKVKNQLSSRNNRKLLNAIDNRKDLITTTKIQNSNLNHK